VNFFYSLLKSIPYFFLQQNRVFTVLPTIVTANKTLSVSEEKLLNLLNGDELTALLMVSVWE